MAPPADEDTTPTEAELDLAEGSITVEHRGPVTLIGLNRPTKYNGLTPRMFAQLGAAVTELHESDSARVGVLFGHGDHFTAGLDLPKFRNDMLNPESSDRQQSRERGDIDVFGLGRWCAKPIVVAVKGVTFTAGIEMMLGCDIVVAADNCRFSQLEPKRGIMATGGATVRFAERGGYGNAMYHLLIVDEFDAPEALRVGLVQEVVPAGTELDRAIELAEKIAELAPLAVQATKASTRLYLEEGQRAAIKEFSSTQARLAASDDAAEGVQSFIEKRPPPFTGR